MLPCLLISLINRPSRVRTLKRMQTFIGIAGVRSDHSVASIWLSHARSSNFPLHRKTYHHQNGQYYLIFITVLQCLKKNLIINAAKSPFTTLYLQDSHFIRETGQSHIRGPR